MKKFIFKFLILMVIATFSSVNIVYGLSPEQKKVMDSGILYFDVNDEVQCENTTPQAGSVYFVGDSIGEGIKSAGFETEMQSRGWQPAQMNVLQSRTLSQGIDVIDTDQAFIKTSAVIVVELGTNPGGSLPGFENQVDQMVSKIKGMNSSATIYWVDIGSKNQPAENDRRNTIINSLAASKGFNVIKWSNANIPLDGQKIHPTGNGYTQLRDIIVSAVANGSTMVVPDSGSTQTDANIQKIVPAPFQGSKITPTGIVLHWTGGSPNQSVESFIAGISGRGLSVQLYIDGSGNVYQLVDTLDTHTSHAGNANSKTIGIEIAAGSDGTVATSEREINDNAVQKQAVVSTVMYIMQTFNIGSETDVVGLKGILSHHLLDPGRKSDVGDRYLADIVSTIKNGGQLIGNNPSCAPPTDGGGQGGNPDANKQLGQQMASERGFAGTEWACLLDLWTRESGWNHLAINDAEGNNDLNGNRRLDNGETISDTEHDAYGIPQSLPGGKMATVGSDWRSNPRTQMQWGLDYIVGRYETPCKAIEWHNAHNWY